MYAERDIVLPILSGRLFVRPLPVKCDDNCILNERCGSKYLLFLFILPSSFSSPTTVTKSQREPDQRGRLIQGCGKNSGKILAILAI